PSIQTRLVIHCRGCWFCVHSTQLKQSALELIFNASVVLAVGLDSLLPSVLLLQDVLLGCFAVVRTTHDLGEALVGSPFERRQGLLIAGLNLMGRSSGIAVGVSLDVD